jgi:hypothetical protein
MPLTFIKCYRKFMERKETGTQVFVWVKRSQDQRENVTDDKRSGHPRTSVNTNVENVIEMVKTAIS